MNEVERIRLQAEAVVEIEEVLAEFRRKMREVTGGESRAIEATVLRVVLGRIGR